MEQEIYVDGAPYKLLPYRHFRYQNRPFAIFIHPTGRDKEGDPILYVFEGSDGRYTMPRPEDHPVLIRVLASVLNNETLYNTPDEEIEWSDWN